MPYTLSASFWSEIPKWLATLLMSICQIIDQIIYTLINWMYRVFILISEVDIFKDGTQIQAIANRMYIIVGIAMLFIFAYNIVLLIINPEGKQLGNMAKVVQNAIISVILIIFLPLIFTYLKTVQNHIVTQNVIGNIVLGSSVTGDGGAQQNNQAGVKASLDIYSAFYHPVNESYSSCQKKCQSNEGCSDSICHDYVLAYNTAYENANITDFIWKKELRDGVKDGKVEYLGLVSALAGGFALWMFISFALDIGIRVGKMAFYEIISPIPVMMRILPGDKMFDKWFKGLKDAYLSIFIRLIVIYTCMYFVTLVPELMANLTSPSGADGALIVALANVIIILGILQFAKEAPKLISDMFGGGAGGIKLGLKDVKDKYAPLGRVADMARSGVYSKMYGGKDGAGGSFFAGAWRGRHGFDKGKQATDARRDVLSGDSTFGGRLQDRLRNAVGLKTRKDLADFNSMRDNYRAERELSQNAEARALTMADIREANRTEVAGYRSGIVDTLKKEAAKGNSTFTYTKGLKTHSYKDVNGEEHKIEGSYAEVEAMYNTAQANGVSAEELKKIQDVMNSKFVTDATGNKVSITGSMADIQAMQSDALKVAGIQAKADGSSYSVSELTQMYNDAVNNGSSQIDLNNIQNAINTTKALDEISFEHNGQRVEISGNLSQIETMLEAAQSSGASLEVINNLKSAKVAAEKQIVKDMLKSVMETKDAKDRGIKQEVITEIEKKVNSINAMIDEGVVNQIVKDGKLEAQFTSHVDTAEDVIKKLGDALDEQKVDIERSTYAVDVEKQRIEREQKEIERAKKERESTAAYKSAKADADAINNSSSSNGKK